MTPARRLRASIIHAFRVGLVVALMLAIPSPAAKIPAGDNQLPPPIRLVQNWLPTAAEVRPGQAGRWKVIDSEGGQVGEVARTLPDAQDIVGYRGPTEALVVLNDQLVIVGVELLQSTDTREHVDAVASQGEFFAQFEGWDWRKPPTGENLDGVTGATLTSLALAEGVLKRMGGETGSLVFPGDLRAEELRDWFPDAMSVRDEGSFRIVIGADGRRLGRVLRSGRFSDDVVGYQGPTELVLRIEQDDQVSAMRIRESYDNEPYIRYVREDKYSWSKLTGRTLSDLAELDPTEARIEGVSGATMTSLAVADTAIAAAKRVIAAEAEAAKSQRTAWADMKDFLAGVRWSSRDLATVAMLAVIVVLSRFKLFHHHRLRRLWLIVVVAVIGLWSGNLISMALIAGWSAEGIAWQLAPGLATIAVVAVVVPPLNKGNPYCNHLCPHGAVQQLVRPKSDSKRRWQPPQKWLRWLQWIPGVTLTAAYLCIIVWPAIDLSSWEPFHAYLFGIAGSTVMVLCASTLVAAAFVPMAYCRLGCPTGRLIDHLRRTAKSDRISLADGVAVGLLVFAIAMQA